MSTKEQNHNAMDSIVKKLEKKGFRWNQHDEESVYMSKKVRYSTFYALVECIDGKNVTVNNMTYNDFLKSF